MIAKAMLLRIANWHGEQAAKAYREQDIDAFVHHIKIADTMWMAAA